MEAHIQLSMVKSRCEKYRKNIERGVRTSLYSTRLLQKICTSSTEPTVSYNFTLNFTLASDRASAVVCTGPFNSGPVIRGQHSLATAAIIASSPAFWSSEKVRLARGRIHAVRWLVCETHRSLSPHDSTIQLFHQASQSVAVPTFRKSTSAGGRCQHAFTRSILYCNSVWGWNWLRSLREPPAGQAYGIGCR